MAGAMIGGLLNKGHNPTLIRVIESNREKRLALENKFKVFNVCICLFSHLH